MKDTYQLHRMKLAFARAYSSVAEVLCFTPRYGFQYVFLIHSPWLLKCYIAMFHPDALVFLICPWVPCGRGDPLDPGGAA